MCVCVCDLLYGGAIEQLSEDEDVRVLEDLLDEQHALRARAAVGQHTEAIQSFQRRSGHRHTGRRQRVVAGVWRETAAAGDERSGEADQWSEALGNAGLARLYDSAEPPIGDTSARMQERRNRTAGRSSRVT